MPNNFKNVRRCGAKTRKGTPCQGPAMRQNGRCRMHNGGKPIIHGRSTLKAKAERKNERTFLRDMKALNEEIESALNG